jgi:hypothetical protein
MQKQTDLWGGVCPQPLCDVGQDVEHVGPPQRPRVEAQVQRLGDVATLHTETT